MVGPADQSVCASVIRMASLGLEHGGIEQAQRPPAFFAAAMSCCSARLLSSSVQRLFLQFADERFAVHLEQLVFVAGGALGGLGLAAAALASTCRRRAINPSVPPV